MRILVFFLFISSSCISCAKTESSDQVKVSLYRLYLSSKDYDSSKIEISQAQVKSDLLDSTEFVSFSQRKSWNYVSMDEFKTMRLQSAHRYKDKYELNLISILKAQDTRDEYLGRYTVLYNKKGNTWVLSKHKMYELELMDQVTQAIKADSMRIDSIKRASVRE